jgi:MFS family permease
MQPLKKTFLSLRNRNFRLYFIGQLISNTGNWITNVALTLFVLKLTGSGFAVGLVAACQFGPALFLSAWAGAIADRGDKRKMLLLTQILEMLQSTGLAIIAFLPHPSIVGLYILAILGGIVLAFDNPLRRSFVSEMVPPEDIPNAVVVYSMTVNVTRVFGPALAGLLVVLFSFGWCFVIDAATYLAVIYCIYSMRTEELHRRPPKPKGKGEVREGVRYLLSVPTLWITFIMLAVIGTLAYNFSVTLPLYVIRSLHGTTTTFTLLYSIFSLGAVTSAFIAAHRGLIKIQHILLSALLMGLTMILLALMYSTLFAGFMIFVLGLTSVLYMTATTTIVQAESKREMHGRLLALQTVFLFGTGLIGGPLSGWLADIAGARAPLIFGGVICIMSAMFGYIAVARSNDHRLVY